VAWEEMAIQKPVEKPIIWTLEEALPLIREWQPIAKSCGFHLALGGGVLNTGKSRKDLDLYFLPLTNSGVEPNHEAMLEMIESMWAKMEPFSDYHNLDDGVYTFQGKTTYNGKRIDVWIL
jgi:hypothetical protein